MNFVRVAHKWLSLVIGLQLALWLASGLAFNLLDSSVVSGRHLAADPAPAELSTADVTVSHDAIARLYAPGSVIDIRLQPGFERPVYRVQTQDAVELRDAQSGTPLVIDSARAAAIAARDYAGDDRLIGEPVPMESANMEARRHQGAMWRVDVADDFATSLYISAQDGRVLERRNDSWRLFDIFWMLHIMDYTERQDFNNPFVIAFGLGALLMSLSGCLLLFTSFSRHDFNLVAKLRRSRVAVQLFDSNANPLNELALASGSNLFDGLAANGVQLPSNCGGGGSCGLCQVRMDTDAPVSASEKALLSRSELDAGYRLACQQRASAATRLTLDDSLLQASQYTTEVVQTRFLTPFIKEIHLRLPDTANFAFRAGSFVQIEVPPHQLRLADLPVDTEFRADWHQWQVAGNAGHREPVRRSYSMANAPGEPMANAPGEVMPGNQSASGNSVVLNVRIQPPPQSDHTVPGGVGSSFMFNLQPGDRVKVSGPFGNFHAAETGREMVIIGGGAGMAPLRSIIVDQLRNRGSGRKISFWYGARSLREVFYAEEFHQLAAEHGNFAWHLGLSEPRAEDNWSGASGFISDIVAEQYLRSHPEIGNCEFYLCGPPPMLKACIAMLTALGVAEDRIAFDDFGC
ncbi:NADH:ubiquinone oxidoreductase, Na(+)-translocating, F subunit [Microbulbifer donghaiensis]|uniref:Na(+)-translocating NADH-quinone reductase subunit F n=1 Tax=Microbulbifer donghaiensis TaxID=494016 RepID=A0A1M4ZJ54_9GAMM|nr:NADH:ubiquinone reductase (Na(+)-transporting) subunit F [Microbulbifer donghaiensis]SHF18100.1 NADH:ubiquinone oxidoreductase, Na(+)-translocating, F subunit [Microbulbifer donghaiensis]